MRGFVQLNDSQSCIGTGQLCLTLGVALVMLAGSNWLVSWFPRVGTWLTGAIAGLGAVLLGLSIALNTRGLMLRRRMKHGE